MHRKYYIAAGIPLFALAVASICLSAIPAQSGDPLIGTWNVTGENSSFVAVMTFNLGGTTVEYDTAGTNSSGSPGESISLGKWRKTGNLAYKFEEENYIYDASGNLSLIAIADCSATLASTLNNYSDTCAVNFYQCSVATCPGPLVSGPTSGTATAVRF